MWTTQNELTFLKGLGTHSENGRHSSSAIHPCTNARRIQLLQGYAEGLKLRRVWAGLDRATLEAYVSTELARMATLPADAPAF